MIESGKEMIEAGQNIVDAGKDMLLQIFAEDAAAINLDDPIWDFNQKEEKRKNWFKGERNYYKKNYNAQYRLKAFYDIKDDSTIRSVVQQWTSLGPDDISGRLISAQLHPTDENQLWVGSANGGLWKTDNSGEYWYNVTDALPSMAIGAIALNPNDPTDMMIGTTSVVGAVSGLGLSNSFALGAGVFRSKDGTKTWHEVLGPDGYRPEDMQNRLVNSNQLVWHQNHPESVFLASNHGLWIYALSKEAWQKVFTDTTSSRHKDNYVSLLINEKQPGRITVGGLKGGVLQSNDNGMTWESKNEGLPLPNENYRLKMLTQSKEFPDVIFADIIVPKKHKSRIYKSSDGAKTWKQISTTPEFVQELAVSPVDTNLIFAGGVHPFRSTAGGRSKFRKDTSGTVREYRTWRDVTKRRGCFDIVHVDQHGFYFSDNNPELIYALTDGGIYRSLDRGKCWRAINTGLSTLQIYGMASSPHDSVSISIGAQDQGTLLTNSYGKIWTKRVTGDGGATLFDHTRPNIMYATAANGNPWKLVRGREPRRIIRGIDNGKTGTRETSLWIAPLTMTPDSSQILFTARLDSIYRSTNGGEMWTPVANIETVNVITTDIINPSIVYAYSKANGRIHRSLDRGITWEEPALCNEQEICTPGNDVFDLAADPDTSGIVYAVRTSNKDQIWRSRDTGRTWQNITSSTFNDLAISVQDILIVPSKTAQQKQIYIGTDIGVFLKQAAVSDWMYMGGKFPAAIVTKLNHNAIDNSLRVSTFGRGVWKMQIPTSITPMIFAGDNEDGKAANE
ncbi:MAG: hypothetical protein AAF564_18890 [Bacteroidota bacterium]